MGLTFWIPSRSYDTYTGKFFHVGPILRQITARRKPALLRITRSPCYRRFNIVIRNFLLTMLKGVVQNVLHPFLNTLIKLLATSESSWALIAFISARIKFFSSSIVCGFWRYTLLLSVDHKTLNTTKQHRISVRTTELHERIVVRRCGVAWSCLKLCVV